MLNQHNLLSFLTFNYYLMGEKSSARPSPVTVTDQSFVRDSIAHDGGSNGCRSITAGRIWSAPKKRPLS